jgi:anti-sigma factor RsiW
MSCSHIRNRLAAYADGRLSPDEKSLVSVHLDACAECRAELEGLRAVGLELDRIPEVEVKPYFATRVRQRIADRRSGQGSRWIRRIAVPAGAALVMLFAAAAGTRLGRDLYDRGLSGSTQSTIAASPTSGLDLLDGPGGSFYLAGGSDE